MEMDRTAALADQIVAARDAFLATLARVPAERLTEPGLIGEWSGRELVAHLGYWTGHAVELIHAAQMGREPEGGLSTEEVEHRNRTVADVARSTSLDAALRRELGSFEALVNRIRGMDPALLDLPVRGPGTLERALREDGTDHYRGHAEQLEAELDARA